MSDIIAACIYVCSALAILGFVFALPLQGIVATSGVIAIVVGLALQNTLGDVFSGLSLSVEKPYECRRCRPSGGRRRRANPASISGLTNRAPGRLPRGFVEKRGGATRYGGRRLLASRNTSAYLLSVKCSWWRRRTAGPLHPRPRGEPGRTAPAASVIAA